MQHVVVLRVFLASIALRSHEQSCCDLSPEHAMPRAPWPDGFLRWTVVRPESTRCSDTDGRSCVGSSVDSFVGGSFGNARSSDTDSPKQQDACAHSGANVRDTDADDSGGTCCDGSSGRVGCLSRTPCRYDTGGIVPSSSERVRLVDPRGTVVVDCRAVFTIC